MNTLAILKVASILFKLSKPLAEHVVREAEYARIRDMLARANDLDKRMRAAGGVETRSGEDGSDSQGSQGAVPK